MALMGWFSKDWHRAALLLSIFIFLFFTYGHVYGYLKKIEIAGFVLGRHRQMLPLWVGMGALAAWWVMRRLRNPAAFTPILNLTLDLPVDLSNFPDDLVYDSKRAGERAARSGGAG